MRIYLDNSIAGVWIAFIYTLGGGEKSTVKAF